MVKGLFRPNFRLVIDALNYQNVIDNPNWKKSDVGKKIKKMIIIFYYNCHKSFLALYLKIAITHNFNNYALNIE